MRLGTLCLYLVCGTVLCTSLVNGAYFDFYAFSQGWPGTACTYHRCQATQVDKAEKGFLIHGLWPDYNNGSYPQFCGEGLPFSADALKPILGELYSLWPSLYSDYNSFWGHEWEKHGRCTEPYFKSQLSFFQTVVQLRGKIDLLGALAKKGIIPSPDRKYAVKDIIDAFSLEFGVAPVITCEGSDLGEVWFGMDKDNLKAIDFPQMFVRNHLHSFCGKGDPAYEVRIPPFPTEHQK